MSKAPTTPSKIHKVDDTTAKFWKDTLASKTAIEGFKKLEPIQKITVELFEGYSVDITLVNGDADVGPYVDAVLFDDGIEVQAAEPCQEELTGDYHFWDSVEDREINLRVEVEGAL